MSLETEISQLTKAINELNAKFERFFNQQTPQQPIVKIIGDAPEPEPQQPSLIPEAATKHTISRQELKDFCMNKTRENTANRDIAKAIMLQHFDARKIDDLADNQLSLCYELIMEATK